MNFWQRKQQVHTTTRPKTGVEGVRERVGGSAGSEVMGYCYIVLMIVAGERLEELKQRNMF